MRPVHVLTWNLFHGRSVPDTPRSLRDEFATAIAGWAWDVALLQEVPPWWPQTLAARAHADQRAALTSRNALLPLRRALADRRPDRIKSNGGGANAILVRDGRIADHRVAVLRHRPERRIVHAVRLASGIWVANLHAQASSDARATADIERAAGHVTQWADGAPAILGGDFNVRDPAAPGFAYAGGDGVDHVLVGDDAAHATTQVLDAGPLSDHLPLAVDLSRFTGTANVHE
jgi:endonuclease/exonuclease/phosphatase family metal-dependent hydrolase